MVALVVGVGYALVRGHVSFSSPGAGASASASAAPASGAPAAAGNGSAFVFATSTSAEPTIYNFIQSAGSSIDMTMYELSDSTVVNDLIAKQKAGVTVRVILDLKEKSTNQSDFSALQSGGVGVVWSSTAFSYTHQKTVTIDNRESAILTGNLTSSDYTTTRDYGFFDDDANDVAAIVAVFNADYAHSSITASDGDDLLWSPNTAQSRLLSVINGATKALDVEGEEFSDSTIVDAIAAKAKAGVAVRVVIESPSQYSSEVNKVVSAGGKVVGYSGSTGLYIHAKAVVADAGQSDQTVELGSMNLTAASLDQNRELGIILHDGADVSVIENQFSADFGGGAAQT
ncbi:MAG TPA: phospholipase D-like domain-containing protein [Actinocrinis sp.]